MEMLERRLDLRRCTTRLSCSSACARLCSVAAAVVGEPPPGVGWGCTASSSSSDPRREALLTTATAARLDRREEG